MQGKFEARSGEHKVDGHLLHGGVSPVIACGAADPPANPAVLVLATAMSGAKSESNALFGMKAGQPAYRRAADSRKGPGNYAAPAVFTALPWRRNLVI